MKKERIDGEERTETISGVRHENFDRSDSAFQGPIIGNRERTGRGERLWNVTKWREIERKLVDT